MGPKKKAGTKITYCRSKRRRQCLESVLPHQQSSITGVQNQLWTIEIRQSQDLPGWTSKTYYLVRCWVHQIETKSITNIVYMF